jgi:hypothetical protein
MYLNNNCVEKVSLNECALACANNPDCKAYFSNLYNRFRGDNMYRCCLYRQVRSPFSTKMGGPLKGGNCGILNGLF